MTPSLQGLAVCLSMLIAAGAVGARTTCGGEIDFNQQVRPLLYKKCVLCHGPDPAVRESGLRLDTSAGAYGEGDSGEAAIVPGNPQLSEVIRRIASDDEDERMPPADSHDSLSPDEIKLLTDWVAQGAKYAQHWSYTSPVRPEPPAVQNKNWGRNAIDAFILKRLEQEGLQPSPEADRYALARRLSLDLTGLPPTIEEVDAFVRDATPQAYERFVDQLLAKETYGEHWARKWLDLARYGDSAGYAEDKLRTIWSFRDYVIRSLNANKPFDQFTIEQLAGDLLEGSTQEQQIATAFHRNTLTNSEGGTDDEEFRSVAVVDRVNTTMAVWMGTTVHCAQCHNHKYDPISQEEYFQLFAILNNTEDADREDEQPVIDVNKTTVPVMRELPTAKRRKTHIQMRGDFLNKGKEVTAGFPAIFTSARASDPPDRLAMARWLVDGKNPMTARVVTNRYWEAIFGIGIVRTSEEFGSQGDRPSHPKLLDWLAVEFVECGWDAKHMLRLLVTSAAYRQSARVTPKMLERDPDNRWLARGPRFRLSAEMIRDQALAVSGLLSAKMYGPPVRPPQPTLGVKAAFGGEIDWETSTGEDRYRRGLYTRWRRSNPYPSMVTFDAPNRETCAIRRDRTNTPLQALVTLNDPVYIEAAQSLARRLLKAGSTPGERAHYGFRLCLARKPGDEELARLVALYESALERFRSEPKNAQRFATDPLGPIPKDADVAELAAWTLVANVLLNLDEVIMKK